MVQLFEMILIEIFEERPRPDRMRRNREIVNVLFPIAADFVGRRHARTLYYLRPRIPE